MNSKEDPRQTNTSGLPNLEDLYDHDILKLSLDDIFFYNSELYIRCSGPGLTFQLGLDI